MLSSAKSAGLDAVTNAATSGDIPSTVESPLDANGQVQLIVEQLAVFKESTKKSRGARAAGAALLTKIGPGAARTVGKAALSDPNAVAEEKESSVAIRSELLMKITESKAIKVGDKEVGVFLVETSDRESKDLIALSWKRYTDFAEFQELLKLNMSESKFNSRHNQLPSKKPFFISHTSSDFLASRKADLDKFLQGVLSDWYLRPLLRRMIRDFAFENSEAEPEDAIRIRNEKRVALKEAEKNKGKEEKEPEATEGEAQSSPQ